MGAVGRHDVAGRIFNKLVSDRKLLAAYYTSIPASILLAGLALSPTRWTDVDWSDAEEIAKLSVVDPACGTGTLLMAAYRQIAQNYTAEPGTRDVSLLHKALVESVIMGADVVQAAIHMTAATLAAMSPFVRFEQMQLHTLCGLGVKSEGDALLGSLDWLKAPEIQSSFSATEEQVGAVSGTGGLVSLPSADLVISNPPYTRRGSDGGKECGNRACIPTAGGRRGIRESHFLSHFRAVERHARESDGWTRFVVHGACGPAGETGRTHRAGTAGDSAERGVVARNQGDAGFTV